MVNIEIPKNYTNSPSSFNGTPQWTINRDITSIDLDSSNAFEGPEKLLEVWFSPSEKTLPASASPLGLKSVSQEVWKEMLDSNRYRRVLSIPCTVIQVDQDSDRRFGGQGFLKPSHMQGKFLRRKSSRAAELQLLLGHPAYVNV